MTTSPSSPPLPQQDPEFQTPLPNSTQHDDNQNHHESQPQSPQTLESQNPQESQLNRTYNQQQEAQKEDASVLEQKGDQLVEESGMSSRSPSPLIIPTITDQEVNPRTLTSPTSLSRRPNKRKKGGSKKQKAIEKKVQTLIENLKPIPFKPSKNLNFAKHEKFLKRLGLWDFVHIELDRDIRVDLIAQLIANYESRASYVNGYRVAVNRADLGRAFKLPVKKDKGSASALSSEVLDLDSDAAATEESVGFIEDFVSNWLLLHEDTWILPTEVVNWTKSIKDGHPEKVDWASLIWFMVEKELNQGKQLKECYYASHLQYLIRSQREELFREENRLEEGAEVKEEEDGGEVEMWQESKGEAVVEVKEEEDDAEVKIGQDAEVETVVEVKKDKDGGEMKMAREHEVEAGVEVKEEEGDGGKVTMGKEPMVEARMEINEEEEDGGKVTMGKEPMVEARVEVNEEEEDGGKVTMGKEPMVEARTEVKEEEKDGGKLKVDKEPMVEAGAEVKEEEEDSGKLKVGKEPMVEAGAELEEEEEDGGKLKVGKEAMVEAGAEVEEEEKDGGELKMVKEPMVEAGAEEKDGGELKMVKEPMVEAGVEVKEEEEDDGKLKMVKEPMLAVRMDVEEEEDGGEIEVGKELMVEAVVDSKEEEAGGEVKKGEEPMVEPGVEVKWEEDVECETKMGGFDDFQLQESEDNVMVGEPNVELTLGKEAVEMEEEDEEVKEGDMMDIEDSEADEQGQWLLDGKNNMGDHFLQRCNLETNRSMDGDEERKQEEEEEEEVDEEAEEEEEDEFDLMPRGNTSDGGVLTGNLLQGMEATQMSFGLTETHGNTGGPSIFSNGSKREIVHEDDLLHKRLRTDGPWSHKLSDFETCMEEMQHWMGKARMVYQAKEHSYEESNMNQQLLLSELQRKDDIIEHLHKAKREEILKKDGEIYRLERELYLMGSLLDGYRKSVKETHRAFSEYRQQCQLPEEPIYKDAGPGGLVLSTMELEKQQRKREEEERMIRLVIEQKVKEFEEDVFSKIEAKMEAHFNKVLNLDKRLTNSENEIKLVKELSAKPKVLVTSPCAPVE